MIYVKRISTLMIMTMVFLMSVTIRPVSAQMGGGPGMHNPGGGFETMMGINNNGGFGMMNGMAGAPVVGNDGTVYMVGFEPNQNAGTMLNSNSFTSTLMAINPTTGQVVSLNLNGVLSRPVVHGNILVATASLPSFNNFEMFANHGNNSAESQSVLYGIQLPLTENTIPTAISLDGNFASVPVVANDLIYVTTTSHGDFMMGRNMFDGMFDNFDFHNQPDHGSFLYVVGLDGTLKAKIAIE